MSEPTRIKPAKPTSGYCACGKLATRKKQHEWICDRCFSLEEQLKAGGKNKWNRAVVSTIAKPFDDGFKRH